MHAHIQGILRASANEEPVDDGRGEWGIRQQSVLLHHSPLMTLDDIGSNISVEDTEPEAEPTAAIPVGICAHIWMNIAQTPLRMTAGDTTTS
jgi:hypothetical protein